MRAKKPNRCFAFLMILAFGVNGLMPYAYARTPLSLPEPGVMVSTSPAFVPVLIRGMTLHPKDPFRLDFIMDSGNTGLENDAMKEESQKLIKYFLASMTIPQNHLWVNLSPYEGDKIIPPSLGRTMLGRDLLAQDYLLKQLTATLMYPEEGLGQEFWERIYRQAKEKFGTTDLPVNTFNKVWILPQSADVYEHGRTVYIVDSRLKVMLDSDYQAMMTGHETIKNDAMMELGETMIREVILPEIEREVNEGKNFAPLRQIYHSLILAKWYKETIKESILSLSYVDQHKVNGIEWNDPAFKDRIYARYMRAYQKGVFNYIKEDYDRLSQELIPRKYFSGGFQDRAIAFNRPRIAREDIKPVGDYAMLSVSLDQVPLITVRQAGLTGGYKVSGAIELDEQKQMLSFEGLRNEKSVSERVELLIQKRLTKRDVLDKISRYAGHEMIDAMIAWFMDESTMNDIVILQPNALGVHTVFDARVLAVSENFEDEGLVFLHEIGLAMGQTADLNTVPEVVDDKTTTHPLKLSPDKIVQDYLEDKAWYDRHVQVTDKQGVKLHYALRALFREQFFQDDMDLTHRIKVAFEFADEKLRADGEDVDQEKLLQELTDKYNRISAAKWGENQRQSSWFLRLRAAKERVLAARDISSSRVVDEILSFYLKATDPQEPVERYEPFNAFITTTFQGRKREVLVPVVKELYGMIMYDSVYVDQRVLLISLMSNIMAGISELDQSIVSGFEVLLRRDIRRFVSDEVFVAPHQVKGIDHLERYFKIVPGKESFRTVVQKAAFRLLGRQPSVLSVPQPRLYFREDFFKKVREQRDVAIKKHLIRAHKQAHLFRNAIRSLSNSLVARERVGTRRRKFTLRENAGLHMDGLLRQFQETKDAGKKVFLAELLFSWSGSGHEFWNKGNAGTYLEDLMKLLPQTKTVMQKRSLLQQAIGLPVMTMERSLRQRFVDFVSGELAGLFFKVTELGVDIDQDFQDLDERYPDGYDPLKDKGLDDKVYEQHNLMVDIHLRMWILTKLALEGMKSPDTSSIGHGIIQNLWESVNNRPRDKNIKSMMMTHLEPFIAQGGFVSDRSFASVVRPSDEFFSELKRAGYLNWNGMITNQFVRLKSSAEMDLPEKYRDLKESIYQVFQEALDRSNPAVDSAFAELKSRIDPGLVNTVERVVYGRAEEFSDAIVSILEQNVLNDNVTFFILMRHSMDEQLLERIVFNENIRIETRLYAASWLFPSMTTGRAARLVESLADETEAFIRRTIRDNNRVRSLFDNELLQDEEIKVYMLGMLIDTQQHLTPMSMKAFISISRRIRSAEAFAYLNNANAYFTFGERILAGTTEPAALFYEILSHEILHAILQEEHGYRGQTLKDLTLGEMLSDIHSYMFADRMGIEDSYRIDAAKIDNFFKAVKGDDYFTIESHEGARAQLKILIERLEELGISLHWQTLLRIGIAMIQDPLVRERSLEETVSIWVKTAFFEQHGFARVKHNEFYQRFFDAPASSDADKDRIKILDGEGVDRALDQDRAMLPGEEEVGGIDLQGIDVNRQGEGVEIQFDPASFRQNGGQGINGLTPVIINVTPIQNILPLLGLGPDNVSGSLELSQSRD